MDKVRAENWLKELLESNVSVDGWRIDELIGNGKSAAVFRGTKEDRRAAVKLMDPDLVQRFGRAEQLGRLELQNRLIGHSHPNLVRIYGAGECRQTGLLYVIMEDLELPSLDTQLQRIEDYQIFPIVSQIAHAAQYLETLNLAHRDIKPENVVINSTNEHAVLLDLGVLKPYDPECSNGTGLELVGTLRYSPPEFAFSEHENTAEAYRAITFYQLGALLHDLIMRRPLFSDSDTPFTRLVEAIRSESPIIQSSTVDDRVVTLARRCLQKNPRVRLELVNWIDFERLESVPQSTEAATKALLRRKSANHDSIKQSSAIPEAKGDRLSSSVDLVRSIVRNSCVSSDVYPPIEIRTAGGSGEFELNVPRSTRIGLHCPFKVTFVVQPLSEEGDAIKVSVRARLGEDDSKSGSEAVIFRGLAMHNEVGPIIDNVLMRLLLKAAELSEKQDDTLDIRLGDY